MIVARTRTKWNPCSICQRLLEIGDIFINVPIADEESTLIVCRGCVFDMDTAINDFLRTEDRDHGEERT